MLEPDAAPIVRSEAGQFAIRHPVVRRATAGANYMATASRSSAIPPSASLCRERITLCRVISLVPPIATGRFWRKAVVDVQMLDLVGCRTSNYRINGGPAARIHGGKCPTTHHAIHWVLRGCVSSSKRRREREKKRSAKRDRATARKPVSEGVVLAGKILIQGDRRRRFSDRSFAERLFGFGTPGLLMKRGCAKIRLG